MEAAFDQLAILFRESNVVREEEWQKHLKSSAGGKDILEVLQQDVSLTTLKDFFLAEIPMPFGKSKKKIQLHEALSSQIRLTSAEMLSVVRGFEPSVEKLTDPLVKAGIIHASDVEAALRRYDASRGERYEQLMRQNVLTPDIIARFFSRPDLRRDWPYRHDLMLSILETNALIPAEEAKALRSSGNIAQAMQEFFAHKANVGVSAMDKAKNGLELPKVALTRNNIQPDLLKRFPASMLRRAQFVPLADEEGILKVVFSDPLNLVLGDLLTFLSGRRIEAFAAPADMIASMIDTVFATTETATAAAPAETVSVRRNEIAVDSTSTVQLVSSILEGAIDLKATDIHLEPRDDGGIRVRYRIDGRLRNILRLPADAVPSIISRIKVLANLDVTERRRPQDGHFDLHAEDNHYDFRISTLPCHIGEKVVIRVLDESRVGQGLSDLGLLDAQRQTLERLLQFPYGMILTTGPTGSGKTSTLYSCLHTVNSFETNIVTIEDPVEYQLAGINQVSVNSEIELGFAQGLRAILRQDPDVIMIGEIRDSETAAIAVRAALTGHLVFSTLHTNTALGAFGTLNHMGVKPYMSAAAIIGVVAQRLIRRTCAECPQPVAPDAALAKMLWTNGDMPKKVLQGRGCDLCIGTGYRGRTGLYEVIEINGDLRRFASEGATEPLLMEAANEIGYVSMADAGREKILAGETTLEEVCQQILTLGV